MSDDPRTLQTRRRLVDATMQTIREQGIAKLSARTIATSGGVNQALVFYHFGTVDGLVAEACRVTTAERVDRYRAENNLTAQTLVPVDAVTGSGSGLDPAISVANARLQTPRVAAERGLPSDTVADIVDECTEGRGLGFLGEPAVNVLCLNLALDRR